MQPRKRGYTVSLSKNILTGLWLMQESTFTNYDQLPLFLNANTVAQVLGVSISSAYELMHETGFPALRIGNRIVVPKEKFRQWVDAQAGGDA